MGAASTGDAARADHLAGNRITWESDANDESLGILVFAGLGLAAFGRVQEEPSAPQSRLACNHLQELLGRFIGTTKKE